MKRNAFYALLLGAYLLSPKAQAQKINFTEYDLPNGLHVILHEDHSTPIVAVSVMYHVGSKNEEPTRTGFAHFFEHLMFEGSENIKRGEYMKLVQAAGGELNANTTQDRTFYYEVLPSNQLELALWMESERMMHAKIDSVGVETQRKVVKEEKKQRYDNTPYGMWQNLVFENSYTVHPYRWTPIGKDQYIDQATLPEFMNFYKTFYVPNNAVLVIGGDINIDQTKQLIDRYFATIPKGTNPIPRPTEVEPQHTAEKDVTYYDNIQLPAIFMAYHVPKVGTKDYYAMQLVTQLLSQGKSSRFQKAIIEKEQKAVAVGAFIPEMEDAGLAVMYGIAAQGVTAKQLQEAMQTEIEKVKTTLISDEEYHKLMNQAENDFVRQNERILGIVDNLATDYTFMHDANLINTEIQHYTSITKEDLKRAADKYLTNDNRLVLYYLPKSAEKK